jgi:LytR cell envelope-related transcriptional attenuator
MYARSRHTSTDFDRGQRQQRVLLSLKDQADYQRLISRLPDLVSALKSAVKTDIPVGELPQLLQLAQSVDSSKITSYVFAPPLYQREVLSGDPRGYVIIPNVDRIRAAVAGAFAADPTLEAAREAVSAEGATIWVLNGSGRQGQAARVASYLEYRGLNASAPNQKPDSQGLTTTRIEVLNGAETRLPETIKLLEDAFGVTAVPATDPAARVDIVITTSPRTPDLSPPPAP